MERWKAYCRPREWPEQRQEDGKKFGMYVGWEGSWRVTGLNGLLGRGAWAGAAGGQGQGKAVEFAVDLHSSGLRDTGDWEHRKGEGGSTEMEEEMKLGRDDLDKQASRNTGPWNILGPPWASRACSDAESGSGRLHHHTPVR